jgi:hypothetical protein
MNEQPKSIWKKSWRGLHWLYAWGFITAGTFFVVLIVCLFIPGGRPHSWESLWEWEGFVLTLGCSAISATFFLTLGCSAIIATFFWRNVKRFIFGVACFVTLVALFYAEEDWRGKYAWEKFKREWEAKGEKFDFASVIPPPVPDDQNFALTPIVYSGYGNMLTRDGKEIPSNERNAKWVNRLEMRVMLDYADSPANGAGSWEKATLTDLKPWQDYYRNLAAKTNFFPIARQPQTPAQDVLTALSKYDPAIEELRAASKLPYSRFPIDYAKDDPATILLPELAAMKRPVQVLQLRATAGLQDGQSQKALDDVKLMLHLTQSLRSEPILISHLVRIAMTDIALQPIYEGLARREWSDAQLAELNAELAKLDFLADYEFSMRGEMILGISKTEYWRRSRNFQALDLFDSGSGNISALQLGLRFAPASFFYRNELNIAQMHERWTLPLVDLGNRLISPTKINQSLATADQALQQGRPFNMLARTIFPSISAVVIKYARMQSYVDLARVAIALERYRLAHGEYPESLDVLAPQFIANIPHDIINGQPLHYRRTADGQFVLYSVGWNETDDGGVVALTDAGNVDNRKGDWVWRYPQR